MEDIHSQKWCVVNQRIIMRIIAEQILSSTVLFSVTMVS